MTFKEKLFSDYPIPLDISIWSNALISDLDGTISSAVDELSSDIQMFEYTTIYTWITTMPVDTISIVSVKMAQQFQGNRWVKKTYDKETRTLNCRYYPALVTYTRFFNIADLELIYGDRLRYAKAYIGEKLANKEINLLQTVKLETDNGLVDLDALKDYAEKCAKTCEALKPAIMIYASSR